MFFSFFFLLDFEPCWDFQHGVTGKSAGVRLFWRPHAGVFPFAHFQVDILILLRYILVLTFSLSLSAPLDRSLVFRLIFFNENHDGFGVSNYTTWVSLLLPWKWSEVEGSGISFVSPKVSSFYSLYCLYIPLLPLYPYLYALYALPENWANETFLLCIVFNISSFLLMKLFCQMGRPGQSERH